MWGFFFLRPFPSPGCASLFLALLAHRWTPPPQGDGPVLYRNARSGETTEVHPNDVSIKALLAAQRAVRPPMRSIMVGVPQNRAGGGRMVFIPFARSCLGPHSLSPALLPPPRRRITLCRPSFTAARACQLMAARFELPSSPHAVLSSTFMTHTGKRCSVGCHFCRPLYISPRSF